MLPLVDWRKEKKKKMATKELRRKGTVTNQRENVFIGNGEDYEVRFEGSLKSLSRSMREREQRRLKIVVRTR